MRLKRNARELRMTGISFDSAVKPHEHSVFALIKLSDSESFRRVAPFVTDHVATCDTVMTRNRRYCASRHANFVLA